MKSLISKTLFASNISHDEFVLINEMNEINEMSEMHLKEPEFTHNACGLLTKNKERIRFKETRDSRHIKMN